MIQRYRFFRQKAFESVDKFEIRLNDECRKGWRVVSITGNNAGLVVMLERES